MLRSDVLVVGAGPVGALLACILARAGRSVLLAERGRLRPDAGSNPDTRGYALSAGSVTLFEDLGYWAALKPFATPIREVHVSRQGTLGTVSMDADSQGVSALGQVVPAARIDAVLAGELARAGVRLLEETRFESLAPAQRGRRQAVVAGADGDQRISARLIVAADGIRSAARAAAGIDVLRRRYDADALVFDVRPARAHQGRAFERFTPEGPLALLPQSDDRMNVIWVAPTDVCDRRQALSEFERVAELQGHFGWRLGRLQAAGRVGRFLLEQVRARSLYAERLALVGNVAHGLHPVAGQGLNLSLRDVATLAAGILRADDPGAREVLAAYAAARESDIDRVAAATDFLARGMLADGGLMPHVLGAGMLALDRLEPLRRFFAAQAMGLQPQPRHLLRALPAARKAAARRGATGRSRGAPA
ncbi:2-octaprenyl-6-methoxyphenol hydroxylase [Thioalkalivibrio nitratireducens DSM 14787]|uniref:2-octaprenyl-6-methoxyphenol hydroxylase n=2 Tax=Thioalkalivibrio nitratireducens TaxID=186931 RepID=L0DWJ7_THIND|nr:2-octaprenyl-6-methoxyphenol hydroxylase [Thioalkalivibrio nitratireducens DSM 14787]